MNKPTNNKFCIHFFFKKKNFEIILKFNIINTATDGFFVIAFENKQNTAWFFVI